MERLYEQLMHYQKEDIYPMHMPGHKRNTQMMQMPNPYELDITEIENFDNLHDANGVIKQSMERASKLYRSERTYYLVNGSTVGLLAGIMACTNKGDKVLVARNCHKAVYNAMYLNELVPVYLYPEYNSEIGCCEEISVKKVEALLQEQDDIKLIIITSPTYEGVLSEIGTIATLAHERKIPLLVDEAHGAHLGFDSYFPSNAITEGADLVIHSVHKTMPCFTQTALLHKNGNIVNQEKLERYLQMLQTSSPSYLFMASIDACISLMEEKGEYLFEQYRFYLQEFYEVMKNLKHLKVFVTPTHPKIRRDPSKIVISVKDTNLSSSELYDRLLFDYKIQLEMISKEYVLAMTSICDTKEGFDRLQEALLAIDGTLSKEESSIKEVNLYHLPEAKSCLTSYRALQKEKEVVPLKQAIGRVCAAYLSLYPPGIPILVPGEEISRELVESLEEYKESKLQIKGLLEDGKGIFVTK